MRRYHHLLIVPVAALLSALATSRPSVQPPHQPGSRDASVAFERMALVERELAGVPGISAAQRDAIVAACAASAAPPQALELPA